MANDCYFIHYKHSHFLILIQHQTQCLNLEGLNAFLIVLDISIKLRVIINLKKYELVNLTFSLLVFFIKLPLQLIQHWNNEKYCTNDKSFL